SGPRARPISPCRSLVLEASLDDADTVDLEHDLVPRCDEAVTGAGTGADDLAVGDLAPIADRPVDEPGERRDRVPHCGSAEPLLDERAVEREREPRARQVEPT